MAKAFDLKPETPKPFRAPVALGLLEIRGLKLKVERYRILTILLALILFPQVLDTLSHGLMYRKSLFIR